MTLQIEHLCKTYPGGSTALNDVSLTIEKGQFVVILGKSGAGKSTLLRCINRLVEPSSGEVVLGGESITSARPKQLRRLRRKIAMVFQNYNLVKTRSVLVNALSGCLGAAPWLASLFGRFPQERVDEAVALLNDLGLGDKLDQAAGTLSGGQQQRVGIARSLMQKPDIILADEPVASLDPETAHSIMRLLSEINQKYQVTVLCNLHQPELARSYGHRALALANGSLVYDGLPAGTTGL